MKMFELFIALINAVAWPLVVLLCALVFRRTLNGLLLKTTKVEAFGLSAEFRETLDEAGSKISQAEAAEEDTAAVAHDDLGKDDLLSLAKDHGTAAVIEAFRRLEVQARRSLRMIGQSRTYSSNNIYAMIGRDLEANGLLTKPEAEAFHSLRRVRNEAAHSPTMVASGEATQFALLAGSLAEKIKTRAIRASVDD